MNEFDVTFEPDSETNTTSSGAGQGQSLTVSPAAMEEFFSTWSPTILGRLRSTLSLSGLSQSDAEDLLQEIIKKVWEGKLNIPDDGKGMMSWIISVTSHETFLHERKKKRGVPTIPLEEAGPAAGVEESEQRGSRRLRRKVLDAAISLLPERLRMSVEGELDGISPADTARSIGRTTATVKRRLSKAIGKLREQPAIQELRIG